MVKKFSLTVTFMLGVVLTPVLLFAASEGLGPLGLDSRRDGIPAVAVGDQTMLSEAMEKGTVAATVVDGALSSDSTQRGFPTLAERSKPPTPFVSPGRVVRPSDLNQ